MLVISSKLMSLSDPKYNVPWKMDHKVLISIIQKVNLKNY
jgi:hypothetical protein